MLASNCRRGQRFVALCCLLVLGVGGVGDVQASEPLSPYRYQRALPFDWQQARIELTQPPVGVNVRQHRRDYGYHLSLDRLLDRLVAAPVISRSNWLLRAHNPTLAIHTRVTLPQQAFDAVFYPSGDIKLIIADQLVYLRGNL